jgi:hypothetical protein
MVLGVASLLGATAGAAVGQARTRACSCAEPSWTLVLSEDPPEGAELEEAGLWPDEGRLETYGEVLVWWSIDSSTDSVDRIQAGSW